MKPRELSGLPGQGRGKEERGVVRVNRRAARAPGRAGGVAAEPSLQTQLQERRAPWAPALPRPPSLQTLRRGRARPWRLSDPQPP